MSITYEVTVDEYATIWRLNGQIHREDGPAVEQPDGSRAWYRNGELHREDGPAIEYADRSWTWYLNGEQLTYAEFYDRMNPKEMTLAEIEKLLGYPVKVVK